jgi:DNA repair exonuclease SbcCD ATPase subunit
MKLEQYTAALDRSIGKRDVLRSQQAQYSAGVAGLIVLRDAIEKAQVLIQRVALETQEVLRIQIADVVQSALDTVFPDVYKFSVEFEIKRGRTECKLVFKQGEFEVDILSSDGGGIVDIASLALRVAAWSLGTSCNTLILDEPGKFVSRNLVGQFAEIIKELSDKLNLQVIMVSHVPELIENSDKVFKVELEKGVSHVKEIG